MAATPTPCRVLAEAVLVTVVATLVALTVNALRADGLPLLARVPYQTLVPCPEPGGPVVPLAPASPLVASRRSFLVDARERSEFERGHLPGARSLPYDWLDPVPEESLGALATAIAASGAARVVVYGDGGRPDSGEHLGREISARGIRNVHVVSGGAPALLGEAAP